MGAASAVEKDFVSWMACLGDMEAAMELRPPFPPAPSWGPKKGGVAAVLAEPAQTAVCDGDLLASGLQFGSSPCVLQ
jgi:hypothetical protein